MGKGRIPDESDCGHNDPSLRDGSYVEPDKEDRRLLDGLRRAIAAEDRRGEERAFEAIWHRHAGTVSLICARYLQDDGDIVSATDDAFLRFVDALPALHLTVPLRAYLGLLAKHAAIDRLRAVKRREAHLSAPSDSTADPLADIPDPDADVTSSVRYRELVDSLHAALSAEDVDIILAHAVWGETFSGIAARLGLKENTVKTRYHRALKTYRRRKGGPLS